MSQGGDHEWVVHCRRGSRDRRRPSPPFCHATCNMLCLIKASDAQFLCDFGGQRKGHSCCDRWDTGLRRPSVGGIDIATTGPEQKALLEHQNEFPTSAGDICIAACVEGASGPGHGQSRCWQGSSSSHTSGCAALSLHDRAVQASFMKCIVSSAVSSSAIQDVPSPGNIHTPLGAAHTAVD
jgi:hypothetical protein